MSVFAYFAGLFTIPALLIVVILVQAAYRWARSPHRTRIIRWRTWRIRRLENRAAALRRHWYGAEADERV
jgi:hypothetical protein